MPDSHEILVRYYGAYSVRRRALWRRTGVLAEACGPADHGSEGEPQAPSWPALRALRRRWAELLRRVFIHPINCMWRRGGDRACADHAPVPSAVRA